MFNLNLLSLVTHDNVLTGVMIDFHVISMIRMMDTQSGNGGLMNKFSIFYSFTV